MGDVFGGKTIYLKQSNYKKNTNFNLMNNLKLIINNSKKCTNLIQ
ncbi:MAG: hypothetical protein RLZZ306_3565 [Bacteroidota bacterium]|jgi:hypothetical protein